MSARSVSPYSKPAEHCAIVHESLEYKGFGGTETRLATKDATAMRMMVFVG